MINEGYDWQKVPYDSLCEFDIMVWFAVPCSSVLTMLGLWFVTE